MTAFRFQVDHEVDGEMAFYGHAVDETDANRLMLQALAEGAPYACQWDLAELKAAPTLVATSEQLRLGA
jgi:hypothetical protein